MLTKVSIITPSYNQGLFIERTIKSVLSQNYGNLEYFIFDGGSDDNTIAILQKYNSHLTWQSEKDDGQSHAVNKGFQQATGEIIGWLNSDDIYYPDAIKTVCDFFNKHPDADILYGNACHINEQDAVINLYNTEPWDINRLKEICYICQPAVFFRRRIIEEYGFLDEGLQYCMDYEYWLRLGMKGVKFYHITNLLAGSRLHPNTKTCGSRLKVHFEINNMLRKKMHIVPNIWLRNYAYVRVEQKHPKTKGIRRRMLGIFYSLVAEAVWNKRISIKTIKSGFPMLLKGIRKLF